MANADPGPGNVPPTPGPLASEEAYAQYYNAAYERHVRWVYKEFAPTLDRNDAEDVVMEAFNGLCEKRAAIEHPDAIFNQRIRSLALDLIEKKKRERSFNDSSITGQPEAILSEDRPPDAQYASQECREIFTEDAVRTLGPLERRIYDLHLEGKTYHDIAETLGLTYDKVREAFKKIFFALFDVMSRVVTLDAVSLSSAQLSNPKQALEAMNRLPVLLSAIVRLTYLDKLPPQQIALRLNLASAQEVEMHLARTLIVLGRMYRAKMPDALLAALDGKKKVERS